MPAWIRENATPERLLLVSCVVIFFLLLIISLMITLGDPESPWAAATNEFGDCGDACVELGSQIVAHGGEVYIFYDNDVDDAVVQWATCLDRALTCIENGSNENQSLIDECVAASTCPEVCRDGYAEATSLTAGLHGQLERFQRVFLQEGAQCRPTD